MQNEEFDYIIIGGGAAGFQLVSAMAEERYFQDKRILVLERSAQKLNDKIWCYWEKGKGKWDQIADHIWDHGLFISAEGEQVQLDLAPYRYKKLRSLDFINSVKSQLATRTNIFQIQAEVLDVSELKNEILVKTQEQTYRCKHCFDSRMPSAFNQADESYIKIQQHFKGWYIQYNTDVFDPNKFSMFDFRTRDGNTTSFIYVLPTSKNEALIEFTYFNDKLVEEEVYDQHIATHIEKYIGKEKFVIKSTEKGIIPMTDFPFHNENDALVTKIGTAGSWVRSSTGYSFKNAGNMVKKVIANIKAGRIPSHKIISKKSLWHDEVLLGVLKDQNHLVPGIFHQMYKENSIQSIFRFLDGESSIAEDVKVIASLPKLPFLKSLLR